MNENPTAVSVYQQDGVDDFPVLKAFQQYIDAEQAKARKRMLGLSIFFIMLLVAVVVTFTIVMMSVINRNQALSDRLLEIALRERPAQAAPVVVQQPVVQPVVTTPVVTQPVVAQPVVTPAPVYQPTQVWVPGQWVHTVGPYGTVRTWQPGHYEVR